MTYAPLYASQIGEACPKYEIELETAEHQAAIEQLHCDAFGPGRFARAAFRVREQGEHDPSLSFVALENEHLLASVRLTWVTTTKSRSRGLLLGPLAVSQAVRNSGIGRSLVLHCVKAAQTTSAAYLMLVGDHPYYGKLGFEIAPKGHVQLPGPVDSNRLLVFPLGGFDVQELAGKLQHANLA